MKRLCALFSLLLCLLLFLSIGNAATTYVVKKGDTLHRISKKFRIPVETIRDANDLQSPRVSAGTKLVIPATNRKTSPKETQALRKKTPEANRAHDGEEQYHLVKKGENLKKIARRYSLSEDDLRELNGLRANRVRPGQRLLVKTSEPKTYTVKKGDTIWRVAKKANITVDELKEINGLQDNSIKRGQKLLLSKRTTEPRSKDEDTPVAVNYDRMTSPVIASVRLEEVRELSASEDISHLGIKDRLILFAKKMLHLPYRFGGNGTFGLDCSAYVQKVFGTAGINLPRSAREQFHVGEEVDKGELSTGDLVFFRTYASFPSHVGIYLGNNLFIHASSRSRKVTIDSLETPYYIKRFIGAKRLLPEDLEMSGKPDEKS